MNGLKQWVTESREQQRKDPERYLASYPELVMGDHHVLMTPDTLTQIARHCGQYETTIPTGQYLGKMFIRGDQLCWFGISKEAPMTSVALQSRKILVIE